MGSDNKIK